MSKGERIKSSKVLLIICIIREIRSSENKKKEHSLEYSFCDSDRIQTCNLLIRSQVLYSVELRNHYYGRTDNDLVIISELRVQRYCFLFVPPNV